MIDRQSVMYYCALMAGVAALLSGICYDSKMIGTAIALGLISAGSTCAILIAYLSGDEAKPR